jgi:hypothetical protein
VNQSKTRSKVYNGIRYYEFGETYFCHEKDIACEYPFHRVCVALPEPEKYIDENIKFLRREMKTNISEMIENEIANAEWAIKENRTKLKHLQAMEKLLLSE